MTEIQLHDVELIPERTLGTPSDGGLLRGRLTFGWDVLPADHESAPPHWTAYTEAATGRCLRQLLMVCSFRPEAPDSKGVFRHASLGLSLSTPDPSARPIARLIDPGERTRPVTSPGSGLSFTVKAGILDLGVEKPAGTTATREEWIVRGHGGMQSTPQWEFRDVKRYPLVGDHPVAALVELVPGQVNAAEVLVAAELEHRRWGGLRRFRARVTPDPHAIVLAS